MSFWNRKKTPAIPHPAGPPEQLDYEIRASVQTDVGCHREGNEDCGRLIRPNDPLSLTRKGVLAIVADGMGGHQGGEVASRIAVDVIERVYFEEDAAPEAALKKAFLKANQEIYQTALGDEHLKGMGTTGTALVLRDHSAICAHVGDSRLYLIRGGGIYVLTEDHSAVMEMVKQGLLTLEEARHHEDKNVILRSLGNHSDVNVALWDEPFPVRLGDRFLLCSDGLYDLVEDEQIKEVVGEREPAAACERLIALAKEHGGYDNITVAILAINPKAAEAKRQAPATREVEAKA